MPLFKMRFLLLFICFYSATVTSVETGPIDPLDSPSWAVMHELMLNNEPVVFDDRVIVNTPDFAEDALNVPVSIEVAGIENIQDIVVFADLNPIQKVLSFKPIEVKPYLAFRIKVEQATPVRAAVKTADGVWHVGGRWLDAAGGGCTAPSHGMSTGAWHETLMDVSSRYWKNKTPDYGRLRLRIMHPMDTGLAPGIPEFYIEQFSVINEEGEKLAELDTYQPLSENPIFTFDLNKSSLTTEINLVGRDNNGNQLTATIR